MQRQCHEERHAKSEANRSGNLNGIVAIRICSHDDMLIWILATVKRSTCWIQRHGVFLYAAKDVVNLLARTGCVEAAATDDVARNLQYDPQGDD